MTKIVWMVNILLWGGLTAFHASSGNYEKTNVMLCITLICLILAKLETIDEKIGELK